MKRVKNGITIELVKGNIIAQPDLSAVVNAANAQLRPGGGVAGAIHQAAGPELVKECLKLAPISPGTAVLTSGHNLPNKYIIHCLGPVYGVDEPASEILGKCYASAMRIAERNEMESIGFPAISTGLFGYPAEDAAEVALKAVIAIMPTLRYVKRIRFVLYTQRDLEIYEAVLSMLLSEARKNR